MLQLAKSLHGQPTRICHKTLSDSSIQSTQSQQNSILSSQWLTQKQQQQKSMQPGQSQHLASIFVPKSMNCRNWNFGQLSWPCIDQSQCSSNLRWNPRSKIEIFLLQFPICERRRASKMMIEPIRCKERMCDEWWWKWPPTLNNIYPSVRVCDTSVGAQSLHYNSGRPCT